MTFVVDVLVVIFAVFFVTLLCIAIGGRLRSYYKGVDISPIVWMRQFRKCYGYNSCHVGPGGSCDNCLVRSKCEKEMREEVKREIEEALERHEKENDRKESSDAI